MFSTKPLHLLPKLLLALGLALLWLQVTAGPAQGDNLPAFPGAQGFGTTTPGGRGGRVLKVTTLAPSGPGSLRAALEASGPRIVVFDVGGTIDLGTDSLRISEPYLTLAGQTAPGAGVQIKGRLKLLDVHDVVIRYLRLRPPDPGCPHPPGDCPSESADALELGGEVHDVVVDHSSLSWATDENLSFYNRRGNGKDIRAVTFSWNLIAEGDADSSHPESPHSNGALLAPRGLGEVIENISLHHNLFSHNETRNPLVQTGVDPATPPERGVFRFVNNVVYNWGSGPSSLGVKRGGVIRFDFVHNYYRQGPDSSPYPILCYRYHREDEGACQVYAAGNILEARDGTLTRDVRPRKSVSKGLEVTLLEMDAPLSADGVSLDQAATLVDPAGPLVQTVGASLPGRDAVDQRLIAELLAQTGAVGIAGDGHRRYPSLPQVQREPGFDTDDDGMVDAWEATYGLVVGLDDSAGFDLGNGYTNLENYLHQLAGAPPPDPDPDPSPTATAGPTETPTLSPTDTPPPEPPPTVTPEVTETPPPEPAPTVTPTVTPSLTRTPYIAPAQPQARPPFKLHLPLLFKQS